MKKLVLLYFSLFMIFSVNAQTVITKDFNDYKEDAILNGQDNWVARAHSAGGGQFKVNYIGAGGSTSPDESLAVFFDNANTNYGEIATHKSTPDFQFDFSSGGTIEIELDILRNHWGTVFGVGYDADGDGVVLPPMNYETTEPNPNLSSKDGGVYFTTTGFDERPKFVNGIVLPNNKLAVDFDYEQKGWSRWKIMIDLEANNKEGSVTLFADYGCTGEFQPVPEVQGINAGLKPGSGDRFDPTMWDGIFFLNSSHAGYDNLLVRHIPAGLASQFIDFPMISDQLISAAPIDLKATATSGLDVKFELLEGPATLEGNILTLTGKEGIVKIKAMQGGNEEWQAAPAVTRTFEVIDPEKYTPEITIRRPYDGTKVYVSDLESPIIISLSAYVEHGDAIKFESVICDIDGETVELMTSYPDDPTNGYWYAPWVPSKYGTCNMTATIEQSGGKITSVSNTFEVTNEYDNISVTAFDGELSVTPSKQYNYKDYVFPTHVNAFNKIDLKYNHNCINGACDPYDRVGSCRVKNYRGEWVELYRYVTPFGKECDDELDVTDYTSILQGLVEFELYFQTWDGQGYNPTAIFDMTKGKPEYKYVNMNEIWSGIYDFGDYRNRQPIPVRYYTFSDEVEKANLKLTTTGHNWSSGNNGAYNTNNAAEFYEGTHNIYVNGEKSFEQHLWRQCNPNPAGCSGQAGTWTYNRSGWCPGSLAMVWDYSLDKYIESGKVKLFYELDPTYIDECHPNFPDCVNGQNFCPNCLAADNPILRVSGKIVTYSNDVSAIYNAADLIEHKDPFKVGLFPNPATDALRLTTDYDKGYVCVHIVNMQGQEVRNFVFEGSTTIDISDFAPGMYFVNIIGGQVVTKKLVVR